MTGFQTEVMHGEEIPACIINLNLTSYIFNVCRSDEQRGGGGMMCLKEGERLAKATESLIAGHKISKKFLYGKKFYPRG